MLVLCWCEDTYYHQREQIYKNKERNASIFMIIFRNGIEKLEITLNL